MRHVIMNLVRVCVVRWPERAVERRAGAVGARRPHELEAPLL
jgi:hypothetical protein